MTQKPVLIIGGTGVFGKRLVRHLATRADIALFVSSRDETRARGFVHSLKDTAAPLRAVGLTCPGNLQDRLSEISPFIVIDCSGPFQMASYDTARAVLRSGAHFIDLADARDYLAGFSEALDDLAQTHGVTALTGASSTPTLSTCVADHLTQDWKRVDTVDICITPGGKSEVGRSVIEAILSYAGKPIPIWEAGQLARATGWSRPQIVDVPELGRRRVALVETFDAEHLGPRLKVTSRVSFSAGLESRPEQWGIETLAALRKRNLLGRLDWLIPTLLKARRITRMTTSDTGGMLVQISGHDQNNTSCTARWSLIARHDHGPFVPVLPACALVSKLLGHAVTPGARIAHTALDLSDICAEMGRHDIETRTSFASVKAASASCAGAQTVQVQ